MSTDIENYIFDLSRELRIEDTQGVFGNELELIALVRNCPFLYDKSRNDFKDVAKREATWRAISAVMHSSVLDCQARWKSLREQYGKIKRAIATGDHDSERFLQWELLEDMKFLDPHIKPRRSLKRSVYKPESHTEMLDNIDDENYNIEWLDDPKSLESREIKLINLVKLCPFLYDKNQPDSKDPNKKDNAWISIGKALGSPPLDCKTRWKTFRERYARERKLLKSDPTHKPWEYYEEMSFLDKHVRPRRNFRLAYRPILPKPENFNNVLGTTPNVLLGPHLAEDMKFQVQKLEFVDSPFDNTVNEGDPISLSPNSVMDAQKGEDNSKSSTVLGNVLSPSGSTSQGTAQDEDDLFGQSIAAELKRISNRRKKMKLKANIYKLLFEAESEESN